ncbi:MAG: FliA/WhiG family RNA polymerase sigma factor [Lachnospiraceae bacterium]|nr:FliA/WhiG family RNA polymerase sigma factor [Lachnospiraceae bacterium]MBQ8549152.1 FliA/WhiG family RNA polymerase sigma factor [Lachnospiraceae bacterium]MBQ8845514.1 FliA/WhiG family RNA polymerase sigma factor [Lachnospiraceae bacterium]
MSAEEKLKLWEEYSKNKTPELREKIIIEYAGLVKIVAGKLGIYLGYNVEYDDLVGYGTFGLIDAIDKYDFDKGVKFETYASLRIRGAILDQVRRMDWLPRTVRQKQKRMDAAYQKLEAESGRFATDEELAAELEISVDELSQWQAQTKAAGVVSLDEYLEQGSENGIVGTVESEDFAGPEKQMEQKTMKEVLVQSLESLTEKEKKVILLYYYEELTLKEISEVLEVSESRISQLHTKAIQKLRLKLGNQIEIFF